MSRRGARFKLIGVHLDGNTLLDEFNSKNYAKAALPAQHDAFHTGKRTANNAGSGSRHEIRMRFEFPQGKTGTETLDLCLRQFSRRVALSYQRHHSRHRKGLNPLLGSDMNEEVVREQR